MARTKTKKRSTKVLDVEAMVRGGIPLRDAVIAVFSKRGETLASWGRANGHARECVSRLLGGAPVRYEKLRDDLARDLGVSRGWLDKTLDRAA